MPKIFAHLISVSSEQDTGAQKGRRQGQPKNVKRLLRKKRTTRTSADPATSSASQITCKTERSETHKAMRRTRCMLSFWVTRMDCNCSLRVTISNICPMCETVFPKLETARTHNVKAFQKWRAFCELIRSGSRMGRKDEDRISLSHVLTQSVLCYSTNCLFYGGTSSLSIEASGLGGAVVCEPMLWTSTFQKKQASLLSSRL